MKRLTAVLLVVVLMMTFLTGCGKDRELYKSVKLENYVELSDYLGIEVDTTTDEFSEICDYVFSLDVSDYKLYHTEGVVADGDIINLDYVGKLDGVAFEGGTAQGATLEIGSGTFIDDFEEELIGVSVGDTKDVTATFPNPYPNNSELAGKEAIFTCKVNGIQKTIEEAYEEMDFDSVEDYKADIKERAVKQYILDTVVSNSKISDYPQKDLELIGNAIFETYTDEFKQLYKIDLEEYIVANGMTVEDFKSQMATQLMKVNMLMYYILDTEKLELLESTVTSQEVDQPIIAESYAVQDIVMEYLYDNASIK